jgi:hypothetical protein
MHSPHETLFSPFFSDGFLAWDPASMGRGFDEH